MIFRKAVLPIVLLASVTGAKADEWTQIADGVYERTDANGTVYRDAVGEAGARYDVALLKTELANREFDGVAAGRYGDSLRIAIANLEEFLASAKPDPRPDSIVAFSNPPNVFCGFVAHQMADAWHLSNPGGGPSGSTSSVTYLKATANANWPTANFYVEANITPYSYPTTTVNGSSSLSYTASPGSAVMLTRTTGGLGGAFNATYSTYSYISVPGCTGGFNSLSESGTVN